jgi:hypothetical protein
MVFSKYGKTGEPMCKKVRIKNLIWIMHRN